MWVEKYRPSNPSTMIGNEGTRLGFLKWLEGWKAGVKPALLLGPPGVGKTTLVYAAAKTLGFTVLELNASDTRTKDRLAHFLRPTLTSRSLLDERIIVFLDEVDGLHGRQDYGGVEFIQEIIDAKTVPLVMAANIEDDQKVKKLAAKCAVFRFTRIPPRLIRLHLMKILEREGVKVDEGILEQAVVKADGDVRAAINSVQAAAGLKFEADAVLALRDRRLSLEDAFNTIFNSSDRGEVYRAARSCDADAGEKVRAAFRSIVSSDLDVESLVRVLEALSRADEIVGMIRRTRDWRLLRYFDEVLAYSLFDALPRGGVKYSDRGLPWSVQLRVWNEAKYLRDIGLHMGRLLHVSRAAAVLIYLPYLAVILRGDKEKASKIASALGLDESSAKVFQKEVVRVYSRR